VKSYAADTGGATSIEYALIASLISIVIVTALTAVGTKLSSFFTAITFTP
jgi:pilus assembly protein Flp/PilA